MSDRAIKFRVYNKVNRCYDNPKRFAIRVIDGALIYAHCSGEPGGYIIEQFTGLHDKNGKEIYEGDILDWGGWNNGEGDRCTVEFMKEHGSFAVLYYSKHGGEGFDLIGQFMRKRKTDIMKCRECGTAKEIDTRLSVEVVGTIHNKEREASK